MIKLTKQVESLEKVLEKLGEKIELLEDRKEVIEDNAAEHDRDLTEREQERWDHIDDELQELLAEEGDIENALDYLRSYAE